MISEKDRELGIAKLAELIRFPTVSAEGPLNGSYAECGQWLLKELQAIGLEASIIPESKPNKPVIVGKWVGILPELPAVLLNSHYDVVPAVEAEWTVPPFEGVLKEGRIYGRGAQDMKCVCVQYLVALKALKDMEYEPTRTILLSFVPDEEIGGLDGMGILLQSDWFNSLKIDVALDEGLACEDDDFCIFYGERMPWWISFVSKGNTGHASRFIEGTAVEQAIGIANKAMKFRSEQRDLLHGSGNHHAGCSHSVAAKKKTLGDVTSLNITVLRASVTNNGVDACNVIPDTAELKADIRIPPHVPLEVMGDILTQWCQEVTTNTPGLPPNGGVTWSITNNTPKQHNTTSCDPASNPWYNIFIETIQMQCGIKLVPSVFPAATDSRFLRALGVKAFGFSPIRRSPVLLHEHDEYLDCEVFVEGCEIYARLIRNMTVNAEFAEYVDPSTIDYSTLAASGWGCPINDADSDGEGSSYSDICPAGGTEPAALKDDRVKGGDACTATGENADVSQPQEPQLPKAPARCPFGHG